MGWDGRGEGRGGDGLVRMDGRTGGRGGEGMGGDERGWSSRLQSINFLIVEK